MGIRAQGNPKISYASVWGNTGVGAVTGAPSPVQATGGTTTPAGLAPGNGYRYHVFTSPGTFTITGGGGYGVVLEYLVIAGGGSGGWGYGGGAGAGGLRTNDPNATMFDGTTPLTGALYPATAGSYSVSIGDGATTRTSNGAGNTGYPSYFGDPTSPGGRINCSGGGHGGCGANPGGNNSGNGGSGGGSRWGPTSQPTVATGNAGGYTPPEGQNGGGTPTPVGATHGGGAGEAGGTGVANSGRGAKCPGFAAPLIAPDITPLDATGRWSDKVGPLGVYAGGGVGATGDGMGGGGGGPNNAPTYTNRDGVIHTGGGGSSWPGVGPDNGAGGKGLVVVRYKV